MEGVTTIVKVAHRRLCHSRMMFVRAYPRETQRRAVEGLGVANALERVRRELARSNDQLRSA
jgi:hypothetical protein